MTLSEFAGWYGIYFMTMVFGMVAGLTYLDAGGMRDYTVPGVGIVCCMSIYGYLVVGYMIVMNPLDYLCPPG